MKRSFSQKDIRTIADIISTTDLTSIDRQLRETAILLRDPAQASAIDDRQLKLAQLEIARAFTLKHPSLESNWRTSFSCFQNLYDFFIAKADLENHKTIAMHCWYLQLTSMTNGMFFTKHLIVLGEAFFDEPPKFAAFLYWLLSNGVNPRDIIYSSILHRYFALNVIDFEEVNKTYQLLSGLGDSIEALLNPIERFSCECRGFINHPEERGGFRSYNLMGTYFHHNHLFESLSRLADYQHPLIVEQETLSLGARFFCLFGWKFIMSLDRSSDNYKQLIYQLINSSSSTLFLQEFPVKVLSGELDEDTVESIRHVLYAWNEKVEQYDIYLIALNPFYLHTITLTESPNENIRQALKRLSTEKCFQTVHHLSYLSTLCIKLENMEAYQTECRALLKMIFDFIFPIGHSLDDPIIQKIFKILPKIEGYFESTISQFSQEVYARIDDFLNNRCDYRTVELTWGSYLRHFNFSKYLYPDLAEKTAYPTCKYQLKTRVFEHFFNTCKEQLLFSIMELSSQICDDADQQLRTLQEAVCITKNTQLIEHIIRQMVECNNDFSTRFFHSSFGCDNNIIQYAFDHFNETQLSFLKEIQYTENQLFNTLKLAIDKNNLVALFVEIISKHEAQILSSHLSFKTLLTIKNNNNENLLYLVVKNRSLDMLKTYFDFIKKILDRNEISDLLNSRSTYGNLPYCESMCENDIPIAIQINDYLKQIRAEHEQQLPAANLFASRKPPEKASKRGREEDPFFGDDSDSTLALLNL